MPSTLRNSVKASNQNLLIRTVETPIDRFIAYIWDILHSNNARTQQIPTDRPTKSLSLHIKPDWSARWCTACRCSSASRASQAAPTDPRVSSAVAATPFRAAPTRVALSDLCADNHVINEQIVQDVTSQSLRRFDKGGDLFYDQISALHKSVRGSNPDAALYWFARMIDGGCDPRYVARRVLRMASEDIGNADPRGLEIALNAWHTYERLGSPEGELAIAQAITYLASTAKSNAVYTAFAQAMNDARELGTLDVPMHIRNAPTRLMKEMGHGRDYRYAHDEEDAFAAGETYFPDDMDEKIYYQPVARGLEIKIGEKLSGLRALNQKNRTRKK